MSFSSAKQYKTFKNLDGGSLVVSMTDRLKRDWAVFVQFGLRHLQTPSTPLLVFLFRSSLDRSTCDNEATVKPVQVAVQTRTPSHRPVHVVQIQIRSFELIDFEPLSGLTRFKEGSGNHFFVQIRFQSYWLLGLVRLCNMRRVKLGSVHTREIVFGMRNCNFDRSPF